MLNSTKFLLSCAEFYKIHLILTNFQLCICCCLIFQIHASHAINMLKPPPFLSMLLLCIFCFVFSFQRILFEDSWDLKELKIYIRLRKESPSSSFSDKFADCMSHEIEKEMVWKFHLREFKKKKNNFYIL